MNRTKGLRIDPRAWLVTGPLGRGLAFAIDFAVAVRRGLLRRSRL
jgi:transketolase